MIKLNFNENWKYRHLNTDDEWKSVTLPHDAAIYEQRSKDAEAGVNTGWFLGYDYEYLKTFTVPVEYKDKNVIFEFEGVYHNAEVYINGEKAVYRPYGYTNFYVTADKFLKYGEDNEMRVIARNADQPNSRWYSGAGIYRPVTLWTAEGGHVKPNGVKIRTLSLEPAQIEVRVETAGAGPVSVAILDGTEMGPKRQAVCLNAGAALYIGGKAENMADGVRLAEELLDSGRAAAKLAEVVRRSNG